MIPSQIGEFYINLDDFGGAKNKNQNLNITVGITFLLKWCWFMWSTNVCPVYILQNLVSLFFTVGRGAGDHVWGRGSNSGQVTARQESYPLYNCSGLLKPRKASWRVWERFILAKLVIRGGGQGYAPKRAGMNMASLSSSQGSIQAETITDYFCSIEKMERH